MDLIRLLCHVHTLEQDGAWSNGKCIHLPDIVVDEFKSCCGSVMPFWDVNAGFTMDVAVATYWTGMGREVFDKSDPSSLMAAMEAGTRTG